MLAGAEELQESWETLHRVLKEAGVCECEDCVKEQKTEAQKVD